MAENDIEERPRGSLDLVETSVLGTIIPRATHLNIEDALSGSVERLDENEGSLLSSIAQRQHLFFDETVDVYVVLRTPYFDERALRSYLNRLIITLEVQVVNSEAEEAGGKPNFEVICSESVSSSEDPLVIVQGFDETEDDGAEGHILVVWKLSVFLSRPLRLRVQNPSMVFSATAKLKPAEQIQSNAREEEYLPSQLPSGINLLESFVNDPALGGVRPRLSALRVSRVVPAQVTRDLMRPLKNISRRSLKVFPALNARVRYSKPTTNSSLNNPSIIASLDIDVSPFVGGNVSLDNVAFSMSGGFVEDLSKIQGLELPIVCLPRDDVTFLYRLRPDEMEIIKSNLKPLTIAVTAKVTIGDDCQPRISMRWKTSVDFTVPVNPGFGQPGQAMQRNHRPTQLSISSSIDIPTTTPVSVSRPDALPSVEVITRHERSSSIPDFGVTMTFTSMEDSVMVGKKFSWEVFIVNRSDRSRKLALVVVPKRRRTDARLNRPPSTGYGRRDPGVADAVMDENVLYAMQRNSPMDPAEIVCFSPDIRIGPLAPSACHTVELKFMALTAGVINLETVRIIDLATDEHVEIRDLPMVVSTEK